MKLLRHWKIHANLMLGLFLCLLTTPLYAQNLSGYFVSIHGTNKSLNLILDDLTKQTGFYFTYDSRLIESDSLRNISIETISLEKAIDTLFNLPQLNWQLINKNIVIYPEYKSKVIPSTLTTNEPKYISIAGKIIEKKSKKTLPYATVALKNSYYGTITNDDGSFNLNFPDTIQNPIIVTTFIGYKNQYTPISINSKDTIVIKLSKNVISLQEVVIRYKDPTKLIEESIRKIPNNYMRTPSGYTAYYREKVQKDEKCLLFSEAVVEIAKTSYTSNVKTDRTRLIKGRKITNIDVNDTVILKISAGINSMLQLDIINHLPDFLSDDFANRYDLTFSNVEAYKDQLAYVISFKQKEFISALLFRGELYLDMNTLAIIAANFEYDPIKIRHEPELFISKKSNKLRLRPLSAKYHVEYRSNKGSYHLSQVQGEVKFKIRHQRKWISSKYKINLDLAVTNVDPDNPPKIKMSEQLKPSTILSEEKFKYDPEFWGDYTTISHESSLQESLKNIQKALIEINTADSSDK